MGSSPPSDYAERIRAVRDELDATQSQFAERIGVSYVTVNRWENGQNTPNPLAWEKVEALESRLLGTLEDDDPEGSVPLDFDGSPEGVRAVVEAMRLQNAHEKNPSFASEIARIDPLPHQYIAVYERMLGQPRLRFLLADDAGAGKTIMSGLYIREMLSRGLLRRILIVPPAGLVGNWQRELDHLFNLDFGIVSGADARSGNPFVGDGSDQLIVSVDTLAADSAFKQLSHEDTPAYDLVIFDEAHKLSVRKDADGRLDKTNRYRLAETIAGLPGDSKRWHLPWQTHHLLLLTATPHMGKDFPYYGLWRLLEPEVLATQDAFHNYPQDARRRHFIRRTKEEMVRYDGEPIYPKRISDTLSYSLSDDERKLYDATTEYLDLYYNQARMLNRSAMHLAKSVFQRRLVSSTYALLQSFKRRDQKLSHLIQAVQDARLSEAELKREQARLDRVQDVFNSMTADEEALGEGEEESEQMEEEVLAAVASMSLDKLNEERDEVRRLIDQTDEVHRRGMESKFQRLVEVLDDPKYQDEKMIIFTEHRDTLTFIVRRLKALGYTGKIAQIHGGMPHPDRDQQVEFFRKKVKDGGAQYLVATDAAGEGINLQFCWLMVNYDVPWNPARLEQRMGRIHRYGQDHDPVIIMNLVAKDTREGRVQQTLLDKLDRIRKELGSDKVFDVIGEVLEDISIRDYIERALSGDIQGAERDLDERITADRVRDVEKQREKAYGGHDDVESRLEELNEKRKHRKFKHLLPGYAQQFLARAAPLLDLEIQGDLGATFRLQPAEDGALDPFVPLLERYPEEARSRLTTQKPGYNDTCIWLHPGEPLFDRMQAMVMNQFRRDARRGAMFADASTDEAYLLYFLKAGIKRQADPSLPRLGTPETRGTTFAAIRVDVDRTLTAVSPEQVVLLRPYDGPKGKAMDVIAQSESIRPHVREYTEREVAGQMVEDERNRLESTLDERVGFLKQGFRYRKAQLAEQRTELRKQVKEEVPGAKKRYAEIKAQQRELKDREKEAVATLRREPELVQPMDAHEMACALVVPTDDPEDTKRQTEEVEARAMKEAMAFERARGASVEDVSEPDLSRARGLGDWPGYDLLATNPDGTMRAIEVKGRARVGDVTLSENEWSAAITQRDEYWLYVVYDCATSSPRLLRVQDPHGSVVARPTGDVVIDETEIFTSATED